MPIDRVNRNLWLLAACQALGMTASSLSITITALVGRSIAGDPALATVPLALQLTATMAMTVPAAFIMRWLGRRRGLTVGAVLAISSGALGTVAVLVARFDLLCLSSILFGGFTAYIHQYRFAAAEAANEERRSRAIALVLSGGVVAAVCGPQLALWTRDLFAPVIFAGCYATIAALGVLSAAVLQFIDIPRPAEVDATGPARPVGVMIAQPTFIVALLGGMLGYGAMSLVMTVTPLAMAACSHPFAAASFVIQWHVMGMYAPSFVTGRLIARFGPARVMAAGAVLVLLCAGTNLSGVTVAHFVVALALLGAGWNLLFVSATSLLTEAYRPEERARAQAINDFMVFSMAALSSFLAGVLESSYGWDVVNLAVLPAMAVVLAALLWLRSGRTPRLRAAAG
jgi:MFS family permease